MHVETRAWRTAPIPMRLTAYTDYALRTLMYLAMHRDRLVTIQEIADEHGIAKNHLSKVVHQLSTLGYIEATRGRNGGLQLGREPKAINIGSVMRHTEADFHMAACFDDQAAGCIYSPACGLKGTLSRATRAFLDVLDEATLDGMIKRATPKQAGRAVTEKTVTLQFKRPAKRTA
jgi:Rrf2 family nitric oxide-sensitive transcriptional repressor